MSEEREISIPNIKGDYSELLESYARDSVTGINNSIDAKPNEYIEFQNSDDLLEVHIQDYILPQIEEESAREQFIEELPVNRNSRTRVYNVGLPVKLVHNLDKVIQHRASIRIQMQFELKDGYLVTQTQIPLTENKPDQYVSNTIGQLRKIIEYKNTDVKKVNDIIRESVQRHITHRKQQLEQQRKMEQVIKDKISIKFKKKNDSPEINFQVKRKLKVLQPKEKSGRDPSIPEESLNAVIDLIRNQGRGFELTPRVFSRLDEESLRDIILSTLNTVLEGVAVGETFVKLRKSDIHLRLNEFDGGILTGECKYWNGPDEYQDAMNQRFDYLTIQEAYAIQITFSRNKGFTEVVEKATLAAKEHKTYVENSYRNVQSNYFITKHKNPEDKKRIVEFHHLLFNLYFEKQKI